MKRILLIIALLGFTGTANAAIDLTSQAGFNTFSDELGSALAYRSVAPADPLGLVGFDIAVEGTSASIGGDTVIIPKLKFQKGLPGKIDIAGYYTQLPLSSVGASGDGSAYGVALSYAILKGGALSPALAVRGSYTNADVPGVIGATTTGVDLEISKGLPIISPYAGIGLVNISTSDGSGGTACGGGGCAGYSAQKTRYFVGANFNLKIMDIAVESGKTGDNTFTTFKLGFRF